MDFKAVNLEKQVECPICLEQYKEPKVLSCLHSYCKSCLQKYVTKSSDKQHKITCPECRQETEVPNGDVSKLQGHFWVNNIIGLLAISSRDKKQKPEVCENCDSGDTAASRCIECCVFMCDFCVKAHRRMHNFKHHQIVSLEEVKSGSPKALMKPVCCEKHGGEVLKLFCQTCDKPICRDCTIVEHQGHTYVFIADAVTKEKAAVKLLLEKTKSKAPVLANGVKTVEEMEKRVQAKENAVAQEITALKNKELSALEKIFANIKHKAKTMSQAKLKQLQAQREGLMIALASVNNSVEFTERALKDGGDVEVLSMKKQLVTNLSKLSSSNWECEPCQEDTFQLTVHQDISQVAGNIITVDDFYVVPDTCTISMVGGEEGVIYDTLAGQRREFTVLVFDNHGKQIRGKNVHVSVVGPGTQQGQSSDIQVTDNNNGSYSFAFLPRQEGCYQLRVRVSSRNISGSPFQWKVFPPAEIPKPPLTREHAYSHVDYDAWGEPQILTIGVSRCTKIQRVNQVRGGVVHITHVPGTSLSDVQLMTGTLSWKVMVFCQNVTGHTIWRPSQGNIWAIDSTGHRSPPGFGNVVSWKPRIDNTGRRSAPQFGNAVNWNSRIGNTGHRSAPRSGPNVGDQNSSNIKSWQAGDVFVLFMNLNTRKLIIQNLRTSETEVFEGIQGAVSPYLCPNVSDTFSLDV